MRRVLKIARSLSSWRSPRSPSFWASWKRSSTADSEIFRTMTALISWPAPAATDITWSSSPCQRPMEERISG